MVEDPAMNDEMVKQAEQLLHSEYGRSAIASYIEELLGVSGICFSKDMHLTSDKAYIMSLLSVLAASDTAAKYQIKELDGKYSENGYEIPQLQITRKEEEK